MAARDTMAEDLEKRTEEGYAHRDRDRQFANYFKPGTSVPTWSADKGEHYLDIIPYRAGKYDPTVSEGTYTYVLDVRVHRDVGPSKQMFVCPSWNYKGACPICEEADKIRKEEEPDSERQKKAVEQRLKDLTPKRRVMYNVWVQDNKEQIDKGIQVWEIAHYHMELELLERAKKKKKDGGGYVMFAHPTEGRVVFFDRTGVGMRDTAYEGISLESRDYVIPHDIQKDALCLDDLIHIPTYDEIYEAFWDQPRDEVGVGKEIHRAQTPVVADEEEQDIPHVARRRPSNEDDANVGEDIPRPRSRRPDSNDEPETPRRGRASEDTDDAPPPRRGRAPANADEEAPRARPRPRQGDGGTDEVSLRRGHSEEEESPPTRSESSRLVAEDEPETIRRAPRKVGANEGGEKCPIPGGTFGVDTHSFDECDTCPLYKACARAQTEAKRGKRPAPRED